MIENYLIQNGFGCGSVKNFSNEIVERSKFGKDTRWYFSTPIKTTVNANLAECTLHLAFPFLAQYGETVESGVYAKTTETAQKKYFEVCEFFKEKFLVPKKSVTFVPFWSGSDAEKRTDRKDFANTRVHILAVDLTLRYKESWLVGCPENEVANDALHGLI